MVTHICGACYLRCGESAQSAWMSVSATRGLAVRASGVRLLTGKARPSHRPASKRSATSPRRGPRHQSPRIPPVCPRAVHLPCPVSRTQTQAMTYT